MKRCFDQSQVAFDKLRLERQDLMDSIMQEKQDALEALKAEQGTYVYMVPCFAGW